LKIYYKSLPADCTLIFAIEVSIIDM